MISLAMDEKKKNIKHFYIWSRTPDIKVLLWIVAFIIRLLHTYMVLHGYQIHVLLSQRSLNHAQKSSK